MGAVLLWHLYHVKSAEFARIGSVSEPRIEEVRHGEPASGYAASAAIFAGVTALWAFVVRDDPYYRIAPILGVRLPATMLFFLIVMPLAGFIIGLWRYDRRHHGGGIGFAGKLIARGAHFTYAHFLIVLFTVAMATDYFLGLNIDEQVRSMDDRTFEVAARFAPWLCAYLAGFNLGRATRISRDMARLATTLAPDAAAGFAAVEAEVTSVEAPRKQPKQKQKKSGRKPRVEPPSVFLPALDEGPQGDLGTGDPAAPTPTLTSSGLPQASAAPAAPEQPGYLPPQDFSKLRPTLQELR